MILKYLKMIEPPLLVSLVDVFPTRWLLIRVLSSGVDPSISCLLLQQQTISSESAGGPNETGLQEE